MSTLPIPTRCEDGWGGEGTSCAWPSGRASQRERHREQLLELLSSPRQREVFISDINIAMECLLWDEYISESYFTDGECQLLVCKGGSEGEVALG